MTAYHHAPVTEATAAEAADLDAQDAAYVAGLDSRPTQPRTERDMEQDILDHASLAREDEAMTTMRMKHDRRMAALAAHDGGCTQACFQLKA